MPPYADVEIKNGQVYSLQYDDIYYNTVDGPAESEYVFLEGNDLPRRWQGKTRFSIAETGFGTGLNFLTTLKSWLNDPERSKTLDYFAIEAYPLRLAQLIEIHSHWPKLKAQSKALIERYPNQISGCHSLCFEQGHVQLHLIFERLESSLQKYRLAPDCWFLDGFSPARNPSMWSTESLNNIALQSQPGTSLATFTAAGEVRRNLAAAGFEVRKRKGFGRKREMLCARKPKAKTAPVAGSAQNSRAQQIKYTPWFASPEVKYPLEKVAVIGAGIAGVQTAWHLARRGVEVVLIEQGKQIASAASGNLAGILAPKLTAAASVEEAFYVAAFGYQLRQIEALKKRGHKIGFVQHGLLQLPHNQNTLQRFERLRLRKDLPEGLCKFVDTDKAAELSGEALKHASLLIEQAGSLSPASLCQALLEHPKIELRLATSLTEISHEKAHPHLTLSTGELLNVDAVVIANGYQADRFSDNTPITPVRGQTSSARLPDGNTLTHSLRHAGYMASIPGKAHSIIFGASYVREELSDQLHEQETQRDFDILKAHLPKLASSLTDIKPSHAAIRATTTDRWPIVGPLGDADFFQNEYADLHQGKQYKSYSNARYQQGLFMLSGLGSRGLSSAAYCANLLTHIMLGNAPPASAPILQALHPARFLIRNLRKGA